MKREQKALTILMCIACLLFAAISVPVAVKHPIIMSVGYVLVLVILFSILHDAIKDRWDEEFAERADQRWLELVRERNRKHQFEVVKEEVRNAYGGQT